MMQSLHRFICKTAAAQAKKVGLDTYLTVVINNSDQPQTTNVPTKNGSVEVSLEAYATQMLAIEG